jgi:hypothetical protein
MRRASAPDAVAQGVDLLTRLVTSFNTGPGVQVAPADSLTLPTPQHSCSLLHPGAGEGCPRRNAGGTVEERRAGILQSRSRVPRRSGIGTLTTDLGATSMIKKIPLLCALAIAAAACSDVTAVDQFDEPQAFNAVPNLVVCHLMHSEVTCRAAST